MFQIPETIFAQLIVTLEIRRVLICRNLYRAADEDARVYYAKADRTTETALVCSGLALYRPHKPLRAVEVLKYKYRVGSVPGRRLHNLRTLSGTHSVWTVTGRVILKRPMKAGSPWSRRERGTGNGKVNLGIIGRKGTTQAMVTPRGGGWRMVDLVAVSDVA